MSQSREEILKMVRENQKNADPATISRRISMGGNMVKEIDVTYNGETYRFTVRRGNMRDEARFGTLKASILARDGEVPLHMIDRATHVTATVMAFGKVYIEQAPEGFSVEECEDFDLLWDIYEQWQEWVSSFRRKDDGADTPASGGNADGAEKVVHQEDVQPTAD